MRERPDGLLNNPVNSSDVIKSPPPQARGEGSGRSLASLTLVELNGIAATAFDPMKGHILSESDPRAQALLAENERRVRALRSKGKGLPEWMKGQRVFHPKRGYGFISGVSDGKRIEATFDGGRALVQIQNLKKV